MHIARRNILARGSIFASALSLLASCSHSESSLEAEIPPEAEDETAAREAGNGIVEEIAGVRVEADVDWGGDQQVFEFVTPVRVEIRNDGSSELRVDYREFELQAANGETFPALPLYRIGGSITEPVIVSEWEYTPVYQEGFYVAPYAAPFYDGDFLIYEGEFDYEPSYYETYYGYWADISLPTPYMIAESLPEGVVPKGGRLVGWLYFEKVPDRQELEPIYLTMSLVDADSGERIGRIRLPFAIK